MDRGKPLPRWLVFAGSLFIIFHLFALAVLVIAAPSGPWPTQFGASPALEPPFAQEIDKVTSRYLQPLHLTHNYHFSSNRPDMPSVYFEVRIKDKAGKEIQTLKFPQEKANFWVQHRQSLLAQNLGEDQPVQAPRGVAIPGPGQKPRMLKIWKGEEVMKMEEVPDYKIPRDRPVFRPSKVSLLLANSYMRYLGGLIAQKDEEAVSIELVRHSRNPVRPEMMLLNQPLPGTFDEMVCSFGEVAIEK